MKKVIPAWILVLALLTGGASPAAAPELTQYHASFLTLFNTVTNIIGYAENEEAFRQQTQEIYDELLEYHQFYDVYNEYDGISNIRTINEQAGKSPVTVDRRIIDLLLFCREMAEVTDGCVDASMGSVLKLWHDAREAGIDDPESAKLPDTELLKEAKNHTGFSLIEIDEEKGTVYISDPEASLDVGAIAKGFAVEQVCRNLPEGYLISVGGNVYATGPKANDEGSWTVGIQNPDGGESVAKLSVSHGAVVSSGDYQRYYTVDGKRYHHIIDPDTLFPADYWRAVSVVCEDSGTADALSTALYLMDQEKGEVLLAKYQAEAMWITKDGELLYTNGFEKILKP